MENFGATTALLTDLYELTMAQAYFREEMHAPATFSLFIREYPPHRGYFACAGVEDVLDCLEHFRFRPEDLEYLESTGRFGKDFLDYLQALRFTGGVRCLPEGAVFFRDEPIVEVTAPIIEAQLMETMVINAVNMQVSVATKAARCVEAAAGAGLSDFGLRRAHGRDSGLKASRAAYLAGVDTTSNVEAGRLFGIPVAGTMAHSFITSFREEIDAFRAFARTFPDNCILLIDTYDTLSGAHKAVQVAREMAARGHALRGVRLDSGDMVALSHRVRAILDDAGLEDVKVVASGGFDEFKLQDYTDRGAAVDLYGVGTKMVAAADAPYTDMAYKLVEYDGRPVLKLSTGKKSLVGRKQVFRDADFGGDTIGLEDELVDGEPLLRQGMRNGRRLHEREPLDTGRRRFLEALQALAPEYRRIRDPLTYPVRLSGGLRDLQNRVVHAVREKELGES